MTLQEDLAGVAWMRMMGVDSVEYHRKTVLARGDDHPGQARSSSRALPFARTRARNSGESWPRSVTTPSLKTR